MQQPPERTCEEVIGEWLWLEYLVGTERYDMQVCTGTRHGEAFPARPDEWRLVNRNATRAYRWLREVARMEGIAEPTQYRKGVERLRFNDQVVALRQARERIVGLGGDWRVYLRGVDWWSVLQ